MNPTPNPPERKPMMGNAIIPVLPEEPDFAATQRYAAVNMLDYGLGVVQKERVKQLVKFGYTPESDQQYVRGELRLYARYWLSSPKDVKQRLAIQKKLQQGETRGWPDSAFAFNRKNSEERLAIVGALMCAEIDRLYQETLNREAEKISAQIDRLILVDRLALHPRS